MSVTGDDPQAQRPVVVFCSYSHDDTEFLEQLSGHLKALEQTGKIKGWDDREIEPGAHWQDKLKVNLDEADIILFLVSASFFRSPNCDAEFNTAAKREEQGEARIIPFIVRPVFYEGTHFAGFEPLPTKDKRPFAVALWDSRDEAYSSLAERISRMADEIRATTKDVPKPGSERARETSPGRFFGVPPGAQHFVGRENLVESIHEELRASRGRALVALVGLAGYGKTAVAAAYARSRRADYDLVAWLRAEPDERLAREYAALAGRLGLPATGDEAARAAVRSWLESNERWLLVFDNASDVAALRGYLPENTAGHVLVTSREGGWNSLGIEVAVDELEASDAVDYLLTRTGTYDMRAAQALAELLEYVPLSLVLAAKKIETDGLKLDEYAARVRGAPEMVG